MKSLPDLPELRNSEVEAIAMRILEEVILSMSQFTSDSAFSKFIPPEEMLLHIRPVAAAFTQLHFTPIPPLRKIYKSHLYSLFYFSIICGIQIYTKYRSIINNHRPYIISLEQTRLRIAKNNVMKELTEGVKVFPPINQVMDIFLSYMVTKRMIGKLSIVNTNLDIQKFHNFMPVTLMWGYLFAREIINDY